MLYSLHSLFFHFYIYIYNYSYSPIKTYLLVYIHIYKEVQIYKCSKGQNAVKLRKSSIDELGLNEKKASQRTCPKLLLGWKTESKKRGDKESIFKSIYLYILIYKGLLIDS